MFTLKSQISFDGRTQLFDKTGKHLFLSPACLADVHPPTQKQSELVSVAFLMSARIVLDGQSAVTLAPDDASLMGCQGTW